jgi:hypothetical protein
VGARRPEPSAQRARRASPVSYHAAGHRAGQAHIFGPDGAREHGTEDSDIEDSDIEDSDIEEGVTVSTSLSPSATEGY